jgi:diacylglycerol kinase (ATP)
MATNDPLEPVESIETLESPFKGKTGLGRIYHAFLNSCSALEDAFRQENAFRQEIVLAVILIPTAFVLKVSAVERAMLVSSVLLVLVIELLNTGVEAAIDRISYERHALSKRAKDMGSAAVLVALVLLACVWAIIVLPLL